MNLVNYLTRVWDYGISYDPRNYSHLYRSPVESASDNEVVLDGAILKYLRTQNGSSLDEAANNRVGWPISLPDITPRWSKCYFQEVENKKGLLRSKPFYQITYKKSCFYLQIIPKETLFSKSPM